MQPQGYGLRLRRAEVYSRFTLEVRNRVSILARSHFVVTVDKNINKTPLPASCRALSVKSIFGCYFFLNTRMAN